MFCKKFTMLSRFVQGVFNSLKRAYTILFSVLRLTAFTLVVMQVVLLSTGGSLCGVLLMRVPCSYSCGIQKGLEFRTARIRILFVSLLVYHKVFEFDVI